MTREQVEIENDGERFTLEVDRWKQCDQCGYAWEQIASEREPICPECNRETAPRYVDRYHFFVKEIWWGLEPDQDIDAHVALLRHTASKLEALADNGWELADSDGEHLYFERVVSA